MSEFLVKLWWDQDGQDLTEYALILVLLSLIAVAILRTIGLVLHNTFSTAALNVTAASS